MDIVKESQELLLANRRTTDSHTYTVPSSETYPYQWLWDSCFHAIILARYEPDVAKQELESLVSKQFEDGMIPHIIYWLPGQLHQYEWGTQGTSALTQPPLVAQAVWEVYRHTNDLHFVERMYPRLIKFYQYLVGKRDPRDNHLIGIINPDESGEDNSPRFDGMLNVSPDISLDDHLERRLELVQANRTCKFDAELCMKKHFWVKDVPFNTILLNNLRILAHMASLLNKPHDEHICKEHSDLIASAMRERMFEDGVFWSTQGPQYEKINVVTWAHLIPLLADLYTPEEAEALVKRFLGNEETLKAQWGIRTVSRQEQSYRPNGFWRGPIWMAPHWFVYHGLRRYKFDQEADWVRDSSIALLEKSGFREYFNPETGEGYGSHNFTWGTLVLDMIQV
jgi:glycogen debranching enzyme